MVSQNAYRADYDEYTVQKGDSLYSIARKFGTNVTTITDINMLTSATIFPGQVLLVPRVENEDFIFETYEVMPGDTIGTIIRKFGINADQLYNYNDVASLQLKDGTVLKIPQRNFYVVEAGDTVDSILKKTRKTPEQILRANSAHFLKTGNKILL